MKRLITFSLFLLLSHCLRAQLVIYSEKFDEFPGYSMIGWTQHFTGMVPWQTGLPYQVGGCMPPPGGPMSNDVGTNKVACIVDCGPSIDYDNSNVFTNTPSIDLSAVSGAWLKYDSYFEKYSNGANTENATVEISVNGGATWTVIQNVPANPSLSSFQTWYIDISAYSFVYDIRIGFRYSDDGGWMKGWAIDNVEVIVPAHKDLALLSVTPVDPRLGYVTIGQGFVHHALVYNAGLDTISSFSLKYRQGTGPVKADSIFGVSIPPFSTIDITDNIPDTVFSQGSFPVTIWVDLAGDAYLYNDTAVTKISGADFIPAKRLAIESGEGTWDGWSPRSMVYLNAVAGTGASACLISAHQYDPMADSLYEDFLSNLYQDYVPFILFDRRTRVPIDSFFSYLDVQKKYFGYADILLSGSFHDNSLTVNGTVTPAVNLSGDYRLAVVVTEDGVQGTDTGYAQVNNYAAGAYGVMGGYESKPNPVPAADMVYDHVARMISPSMGGDYGILPFYMYSGTGYDFTIPLTTDSTWHPDKLKAIVLLINNADSTILNSNEIQIPLRTVNPVFTVPYAAINPNPAGDHATVCFNTSRNEVVRVFITDMSGRKLYESPHTSFAAGKNEISIPVQQLQSGIYLVNVLFEDGKKTLKLEVIH